MLYYNHDKIKSNLKGLSPTQHRTRSFFIPSPHLTYRDKFKQGSFIL
ncbi:IS3 family transposase [Photorhabdus sp. RM322S]